MNIFQSDPQQLPLSPFSEGAWQKASWKIDQDMARIGHASVIVDQYFILIGGKRTIQADENANLVVFDLQEDTCIQVEISGRESGPLYMHSACYWKDNQIIVYGGKNGRQDLFQGEVLSEVGIITFSFTKSCFKAEWRTVATDSKVRRKDHTAHIYNNQMIVLGGAGAGDIPFTGIHILNLDNFVWTQPKMAGKPPKGGLAFHISTLYGNEIYVFGYREGEGETSVFSSLNLETYAWKKLPVETKGSDCESVEIQEHQGKIYLLAGLEGQDKLVFKSFDISQSKWSSVLQSTDEDPRTKGHFSLTIYDNQLVMYGGLNASGFDSLDQLWFFRLGDSEIPKKRSKKGMAQHLTAFLTEAPYSDVIFEVESEQIPAHKWWLCNKSKYFANMFSSGMMEAKSSKIVISDMTAITFRAFLEYLYSDDIELNAILAKDLLTQADKYSVPALKELCEQFLLSHIEPDNYVLLANLSELLEANKLRDAIRDYIAKNIKALKARKDFEEISMEMLRDVVIKVTVR